MQQYSSVFEQSHSQFQQKRLLSRIKATELGDIVPKIDFPKPKRADSAEKMKKSEMKKSQLKKSILQVDKQQQKNNLRQKERQRKMRAAQASYNPAFFILNYSQQKKRKYTEIISILSYIMSQSQENNEQLTHNKIYRTWQAQQILRNHKDTNLGDFIIKLPNPDNFPSQTNQLASSQQVNMFQALQLYNRMFNTEMITDKKKQSYQQLAYMAAFYLMDVASDLRSSDLEQNKKRVHQFYRQFNYYVKICKSDYEYYAQLRKQQKFLKKQLALDSYYQQIRKRLDVSLPKNRQYQFYVYKKKIFLRLSKFLECESEKKNKQKQIINNTFIATLLLSSPSFSELFTHFPNFFANILQQSQKEIDVIYRKLIYGGGLQKVNKNGQLTWILKHQKPKDVITLLRRTIMYKLARIGGLFTRTFISEDEYYIFMVIKASEQHLERYAQNQKFQMQLQFGTTDLFSFEPVDQYFRPLRINKYIKDESFYKKYNLGVNKEDKDQNIGEKSIQSQAANLYKKAYEMNADQLRAKIILDQQQCNQMYRWASKTLSIKYIVGDENLVNQYNDDNIQKDIWPVYFIYNKMIIQGIHRIKQAYNSSSKNENQITEMFRKNIGLLLRLLFLKALNVANQIYMEHRETDFRAIKNFLSDDKILKHLWNRLGEDFPRGYWPYFYSQKLEKMWKKYQINEQKDRSKFVPADRTIIIDKIITSQLSISQAKLQGLVTDYYPIHDPYILKNIRIQPYLNVLQNLINQNDGIGTQQIEAKLSIQNMFIQYQCDYTSQDFTKKSLVDKLAFKLRKINQFSVNSVSYYCGEKLAFYFQFRRFMMQRSYPFIYVTFIIQILLWVQKAHVYSKGSSSLQGFNSAIMIIMAIINIIWVDRTIYKWKQKQIKLARAFGTTQIGQSFQKRVLFDGQYYRNLQNDDLNFEKVGSAHNIIKQTITLFLNCAYVILMGATLLLIFILKGQLYQQGSDQTTVTLVPSILIGLSVQFYNFIYSKIIRYVVDFQNHRTVNDYQASLSSRSYIITFIVTYFCLFIYAFFSNYLETSNVCLVKTAEGSEINDCYYYVESQLVTSAIIDFFFVIITAFIPYLSYRYKTHQIKKNKQNKVNFNGNYFESFDEFYEEQDRMNSFMYSDQIDNTWIQFTTAIIMFTTLVLFGPIVPFLYPMIFLISLVSLHSKKYEIIYFSKRIIPSKVNTIGSSWLHILNVISVLGVFTNIALIIYVRDAYQFENKTVIFLSIAFPILIFKYFFSMIPHKQDAVGRRTKSKARDYVSERGLFSFTKNKKLLNTDIQNLIYNQKKLKRKLPKLHQAYIKFKQ